MAIRPRKSVSNFSQHMELRLRANDYKGKKGWKGYPHKALFERLVDELFELHEAILDINTEAIRDEAADIANFAMMLFDNCEESE